MIRVTDEMAPVSDLRNWAMDLASSEDPDKQADARKLIWAANEIERLHAALKAALTVAPKDEASERLAAWNAAEASAWPELEWPGEKKS